MPVATQAGTLLRSAKHVRNTVSLQVFILVPFSSSLPQQAGQLLQHASTYLWLAGGGLLLAILLGVFVSMLVRDLHGTLRKPLGHLDERLSKAAPRPWRFFKQRFTPKAWHGLTLTASVLLFLVTTYVFAEITDGWRSEEALYRIDQAVHRLLEGALSGAIVQVMRIATHFGDVLAAAFITAVLTAWFAYRGEKWRLLALFLIVGVGQATLWSLKWIFSRARPTAQLTSAVGESFPSGHTFTATVLYGFLIFLVWRYTKRPGVRLGATLFFSLLILLVGLSRVLLSVHWVSDVLGGLSIGLAWLVCSLLATRILQAYLTSPRQKTAR